jgi:hypothetical protein
MTTETDVDAATRDLLAAEERRCAAINTRDHDALSATLADDLHYLHSTGVLDDKDTYIAMSIARAPRRIRRGELSVRFVGPESAVVIGDYEIDIEAVAGQSEARHLSASGMQVWLRRDGRWQLWAHQGTEKQ